MTDNFDTFFRAIYLAEKFNIRLIIPFIDWWGYGILGGLGHSPGVKTLPDIIHNETTNHYFKE